MAPRSNRVAPETQVRSPARSFLQSLDTFYNAPRDRRGEQAFQEGINTASGFLGEQGERLRGERREELFNQGVADAIREQAGEELKGVKTGSIFRQHSRFYMMGLNETRGKAAASKFKADIARAYQEWEGKHSDDDGSSFREWMNQQSGEFLQGLGENEHMLAGALPVINEVANNYAAQHTAFTTQRLEQESFEAYDEIVSGIFDDLGNGTIDMDAAVSRIASEADDMYQTDGAAANDRVVQAAIRYANIHNDPDAILALAKAHDAGTLKISQVNRERLANALDAVEADMNREANRQNGELEAQEKARRNAALNGFATALQENPYAQLPPFSEVGDHKTYRDMVQLQDAFVSAGKVENPTVTNLNRVNLEAQLYDAKSASEKLSVLTAFVANNPSALSAADVARYSQEAFALSDPSSLVNDPTVKSFRTGFGEILGQFQNDAYSVEQVSLLKTMGQRYFDEYMLRMAGRVDMTDPEAISSTISKAEEFAVKALTKQFPGMMAEGMQDTGARGAAGAAIGVDRVIQEEAAAAFAEDAGTVVEPEEEPVDLQEGLQSLSEGLQSALNPEAEALPEAVEQPETAVQQDSVNEIEPIYENTEFTEDNTPVRGGLYGELIQRFTDGKDDRHTLRSAQEVFAQDPEFAREVDALGSELGISPMALMAVMEFESGFNPEIKNAAGSGATGLIQFMPRTARSLGTTTQELARMTRSQQMVYVRRYFKQFGSRLSGGSVDDVYMAVLWPAAIGKPDGYPIFKKGTVAYTQNKGLDTNGDGTVTKYEAASKVARKFYGY